MSDEPNPAHIEELLLNATAPLSQLMFDGWLLRTARDDVKRASSVVAAAGSSLPLAEKIAYCERFYDKRGLPVIFRMTSFSAPQALDSALADRGYKRIEPTVVQIAELSGALASTPPSDLVFVPVTLGQWAERSAALRGRDPADAMAEQLRLDHTPLTGGGVIAYRGGEAIACGLWLVERGWVGLFDIHTVAARRGTGAGSAITARLLDEGRAAGATRAWLSVVADNAPARRVYEKLGFHTLYEYWYRVRRAERVLNQPPGRRHP